MSQSHAIAEKACKLQVETVQLGLRNRQLGLSKGRLLPLIVVTTYQLQFLRGKFRDFFSEGNDMIFRRNGGGISHLQQSKKGGLQKNDGQSGGS